MLKTISRHPIGAGLFGSAVVLVSLAVSPLATAGPNDKAIMPLGEVKAGQKGYGLTVMSGTKPEKFDVEVINVLKNFRPDQDLILIKTPNHPRLDIAHTVAGMSGSPIYIDGKMIGAYAYGWTFGAEPIAGVTPIENMIEDLKKPIPALFRPRGKNLLPGKVADAAPPKTANPRSYQGSIADYDFGAHAKSLASKFATTQGTSTTLARASTPIMLGGLSPAALRMVEGSMTPMGLEPLQAGGGGKEDPNAPAMYEDGGAIGVQLLRGDVSAMGLGTVTRVEGDKLVAFGHPMLGGGAADLPTAIAKVHWILASTNRSFKIGEAVKPMGTLVNDRQASIVVDSKRQASTFPIHVTIEGVDGAPKTTWDSIATHDPFMAPMFTAVAIGSALETTTAERGDMTWRSTTKIKITGYGELELVDFGSGSGDPISADTFGRARFTRALGMLLNNPWEEVGIESVDCKVSVSFKREVSMLRGTTALEQEIDPGSPIRIKLDLVPYLGKPETKVIEVPVPADYAGREVEVELAPGFEVERPKPSIENLADLVTSLKNPTFPEQSLVATIRLQGEGGASFKGQIATRLPPSALDTIRTTTSSIQPDLFGAVDQRSFPLTRYMVGRDRVRVKVRPIIK